jgi:hypothetical protein
LPDVGAWTFFLHFRLPQFFFQTAIDTSTGSGFFGLCSTCFDTTRFNSTDFVEIGFGKTGTGSIVAVSRNFIPTANIFGIGKSVKTVSGKNSG